MVFGGWSWLVGIGGDMSGNRGWLGLVVIIGRLSVVLFEWWLIVLPWLLWLGTHF